jgi:hypothetical protein
MKTKRDAGRVVRWRVLTMWQLPVSASLVE